MQSPKLDEIFSRFNGREVKMQELAPVKRIDGSIYREAQLLVDPTDTTLRALENEVKAAGFSALRTYWPTNEHGSDDPWLSRVNTRLVPDADKVWRITNRYSMG